MKPTKDIAIAGVPVWKVKRELGRIARNADAALQHSIGVSVSYYHVKYFIVPLVQYLKGSISLGRRVAIYLIFPTHGVQPSHRIALNYMIKAGYTPVIVSNLSVVEVDRIELRSLCAHLILRPNFGFDFGGYRDAIRLLAPTLSNLDYLAIFNDSSWFPVRPDLNWLHTAEAMGLDLVGSVFHDGMNSKDVLDFSKANWRVDEKAPNFHYGSYSLLLGRDIFTSKLFRSFWRNYVPTSSKLLTVQRGEMGLTRWVIDNGFSHGAICDTHHLDQLLHNLPTDRLRQIADNLITYDIPELAGLRSAALDTSPPDSMALCNLILSAVARHGPAYALIDFDTRERLGNFIKKAPLHWNRKAAEATLRVLSHFDTPEAAIFLREAVTEYEFAYGCAWSQETTG